MPLADAGRPVAVLLRQSPDREPIGSDQRRAPDLDDPLLQAGTPVISARQQRVTRRRATAAACVGVGETHSLGGQRIHVWRGDFAALATIGLHIAITQVVGQDDEKVGAWRGRE